ncbi:hypothetical protein HSB1_38430 [Halogranum salarium B-1]|uniref:Uncharacterized protein n=1 Tax=Halogranum salarium B-1 TaxID=1210908 RepID=J3JEJ7_9EURY|nr:hypothetical protein HSB1_38430 [Halogranum salarium B-1]
MSESVAISAERSEAGVLAADVDSVKVVISTNESNPDDGYHLVEHSTRTAKRTADSRERHVSRARRPFSTSYVVASDRSHVSQFTVRLMSRFAYTLYEPDCLVVQFISLFRNTNKEYSLQLSTRRSSRASNCTEARTLRKEYRRRTVARSTVSDILLRAP